MGKVAYKSGIGLIVTSFLVSVYNFYFLIFTTAIFFGTIGVWIFVQNI